MKISIDFDATPEEARKFFGLPDVAPLQEAMVAELQSRMAENLKAMEPEAMWRQWMPAAGAGPAGAGMDVMRQMWEQAMQTTMRASGGESTKK